MNIFHEKKTEKLHKNDYSKENEILQNTDSSNSATNSNSSNEDNCTNISNTCSDINSDSPFCSLERGILMENFINNM